jgi:hypothetical protein
MSGVLFKVDFKMVYDNVNWDFLYNIMVKKEFYIQLDNLTDLLEIRRLIHNKFKSNAWRFLFCACRSVL